ncbi:MAG: hypothetical protein KDA75_16480 [Planctomycetaceae bacterium]|nr:hypothetical protein [Planctomycetaceae bacterium]
MIDGDSNVFGRERGVSVSKWSRESFMAADSQFDASASALGYLYQSRYALLLALQRDDDPMLQVSIEKLDDVAFLTNGTGRATPLELLQFKHHLKREGKLTDKHPDIWKSIRVWSDAVRQSRIDVNNAVLLLVTTAVATKRDAVWLLSAKTSTRETENARTTLEDAGRTSRNPVVKECYKSLMRLPVATRKKLFQAIYLLDGTPNISDMQGQLEVAVRHACHPDHRRAFVERLEGWWWGVVIAHLMSQDSNGIPVVDVQQQIHELREQFRTETLPDDFLIAEVPEDATRDDDDRTFIRQLKLIGVSGDRIRSAQTDHYKAFSQRSRWVRDNLLDLAESSTFEERLIDEWKHRYDIMMEDSADVLGDDASCAHGGLRLYNWVQTSAPDSASLMIRPQFRSRYMTRGSYHMLADGENPRVGWHPHYLDRLRSGSSHESK